MRYFIFGSPHTPPEDIDARDNIIRVLEAQLQSTYDKNHHSGLDADDESESEHDEEDTPQTPNAVQGDQEDERQPEHGHEPVTERAPAPAQASLERAPVPARRQLLLGELFQADGTSRVG